MTTSTHTYYIKHPMTGRNLGNGTCLAYAKTLAEKHGVVTIYARQKSTDKEGLLHMVRVDVHFFSMVTTNWYFISATEEHFATSATPTNLAETATVYSMDVARVAGQDGDKS